MATYQELYELRNDQTLLDRITAAVAIAADTIQAEAPATTNHDNRLIWAKQAFSDAEGKAKELIWAILAANESATVASIVGATDDAIQTNVDAVIDVFADGTILT